MLIGYIDSNMYQNFRQMPYSCITNSIKNSPITKWDILICKDMLEPSIYAAKGKMTRQKLDAVDIKL